MLEDEIDKEDLPSFNVAKKFYRACMNEQAIERAGIKQLHQLFKQMGGWPILEGEDWDSDNFVWTKAVRNLRAFGVNFDFFFNITVDIDREHPERYILGVSIQHSTKVFLRHNLIFRYMIDSIALRK